MREKKVPDHKLRKTLGDNIRRLRKDLDFSQEELGFRTGLHRTYIGSIERGEQNVSLDNIGLLAKNLGVKVKDLF